ncbi:hypothetical protein [Synechococcus sp. UW140]|uniref:hypothetical protein n=1 Tax=Synechococcus sp. UW140 TaxID=368503 RepID=UPI00313782ED
MKILDLSAYYHYSAAALVVDGEIRCAAQEERFSRVKQDPAFLSLLAAAKLSQQPRWLLLDDIHLLPMVECWRSISSPKLDLTSFGHWSGTGIVDISLGLQIVK